MNAADGGGGGGSTLGALVSRVGAKIKQPGSNTARVSKSVGKTLASKKGASGSSGSSGSRSSYSGGSSRSSTPSRSSGGGGRSSGGGGGGAGYASGGGSLKAPDINAYLGTDSVYQQALSGGKRSLNDFLSELNRRRGEATTQFDMTQAGRERDRTQQLDDIRQEYASRGLINSGLFADAQGNFQKQFDEQSNALSSQQAALLADLLSQQTNYKRENDLAMQAAKQEALGRRVSKYGIGG